MASAPVGGLVAPRLRRVRDAFASTARGYAYAYVTRRLGGFERSERLIDALEADL
jgi:hypothetical protein